MQLWAARVCPYAQRAYIALKETGVPFEFKPVDLHNKAPEFVELYRKVVCDDAANAKVAPPPLLASLALQPMQHVRLSTAKQQPPLC
jgi:hypothetical protein